MRCFIVYQKMLKLLWYEEEEVPFQPTDSKPLTQRPSDSGPRICSSLQSSVPDDQLSNTDRSIPERWHKENVSKSYNGTALPRE